MHECQCLGNNVGNGTAPARMDSRHHSTARVIDKNGHTIGRPNRHRDSRLIRYEGIPLAIEPIRIADRSINNKGFGSVHLLHREHPPSLRWILPSGRHADIKGERPGMATRPEKVLDTASQGGKRWNRDDWCLHI
jgi:hypothetical protein